MAHDIRVLHYTSTELNRLRDAKQRLSEAQEGYVRAEALTVRADEAATCHFAEKVSPAQQEAFQAKYLASHREL